MQQYEEGDVCPSCSEGGLELMEPENCSCHLTAPCASCMDRQLRCDNCGEKY